MTFDQYDEAVRSFAVYPTVGANLVYPALKLNGEAGEVAEKVGKSWRDFGVKSGKYLPDEDRQALLKEIGDCLWYCSTLAFTELGSSLKEVAQMNIDKLTSRKNRGVLGGSGDNR